jgi:hypothetical protein
MRFLRAALALLLFFPVALQSAPRTAALPAADAFESTSLRAINGWLKASGKDGWLAADVADAAGIPRSATEDLLEARQRGFRSGEVLRIAQASADASREFLLFMVQRPDGEVHFYFATVREGLKKAFVSMPNQSAVLALDASEARPAFEREIQYWEARVAGR